MKRKNKINKIIWITLLFVTLSINAQNKGGEEKKSNYGDSIVIRWAPNNSSLWLMNNKYGCQVYKVTRGKDGSIKEELLEKKIFKPLSKEEMIARYKDEKHPYGMVATQFLYGDIDLSSDGKTGLATSIQNQEEVQNMRYAYSLQAADFDPDVANSLGLRYVYYPKNSDTDRVYEFRVRSLLTSEYVFPGICKIEKKKIYKHDSKPEGIKAIPTENGVRIFWDKGDFTAYFIERSSDGKSFKQIHKNPYITSHMDEKQVGDASLSTIKLPDSLKARTPDFLRRVKKYEFYTDKLPNNKQKFYYRVRGIDAFGQLSKYSEVVSAQGEEPLKSRTPSNVKVTRIGKGKFKISWNKPIEERTLQGYMVLVKHSLGEDERSLTKKLIPLSKTEFIHKGVKEGELNIYSVVSVDNKGDFHRAMGDAVYEKDKTPPAKPQGVFASFDKTGMSLITWDDNKEEDLKGYKVYIRYHEGDDWVQITELPVKDSYLFDMREVKTLTRKVYYCVVAVDQSGNHSDYSASVEAMLPDIIPPVAPITASYKLYDGTLKIVYIASPSNDVKAHHLYRKEKGSDWKLIKSFDLSQIRDGRIDITEENIKRNVNYTYALQAEDLSGLRSKMSDHLPVILRGIETENIDITLSVKHKRNRVLLSWNQPVLKHHKEYYFVLYKKVEGKEWQMVSSFSQKKLSAIDSKVREGMTYAYKIAVFVKGLEMGISKSKKVSVK